MMREKVVFTRDPARASFFFQGYSQNPIFKPNTLLATAAGNVSVAVNFGVVVPNVPNVPNTPANQTAQHATAFGQAAPGAPSPGRESHSDTTLYISLLILHTRHTECTRLRENDLNVHA
jgi:hypothetical protein